MTENFCRKKQIILTLILFSGLVFIANSDFISFLRKEIRETVTEKITARHYDEAELYVFKLPLRQNIGRDILVNGTYYDVVKTEVRKGRMLVYCLKDRKETGLKSADRFLAAFRFTKKIRIHFIDVVRDHYAKEPSPGVVFSIAALGILSFSVFVKFIGRIILIKCNQPGTFSPPPEGEHTLIFGF